MHPGQPLLLGSSLSALQVLGLCFPNILPLHLSGPRVRLLHQALYLDGFLVQRVQSPPLSEKRGGQALPPQLSGFLFTSDHALHHLVALCPHSHTLPLPITPCPSLPNLSFSTPLPDLHLLSFARSLPHGPQLKNLSHPTRIRNPRSL